MEFTLQPEIYKTGTHPTLRAHLEQLWTPTASLGQGDIYLFSGFANFNGGARFYRSFRTHTEQGGRIFAFLGGSSAQNMTSRQVVHALLECGAEVNVVNRKSIFHSKLYGRARGNDQELIVTSGNFTGPGMSRNVESCLRLERQEVATMPFSWPDLANACRSAGWLMYQPTLADQTTPGWNLLYDETPGAARHAADEVAFDAVTMVMVLGHADTARIQARRGTAAGKGSQYFWLSKDAFDFFPPLTIQNQRGIKGTLSAIVELRYPDLDVIDPECRVTFEAENNLDFRLGTGPLRHTRIAAQGDLACISRIGETVYEMRIVRQGTPAFAALNGYASHFIGHQGKRYGFLDNASFVGLAGVELGTV